MSRRYNRCHTCDRQPEAPVRRKPCYRRRKVAPRPTERSRSIPRRTWEPRRYRPDRCRVLVRKNGGYSNRVRNQPMHALRYFPATNDHKPHGTNTRRFVIGGFEIYGDKIFHAIILRVKIRKKQDYRIIEISSCKFCHA